MDRQPVLEGDRLILRPLCRDDWGALFTVAADPIIWAGHPQNDRWREPVFRAFFDDALDKGGAVAVIDKTSGVLIGSSRWHNYDAEGGGSVEIGWTFLSSEYWGGEANRELKRLMLGHAFQWTARTLFQVAADNTRSRRAMEKVGGKLSGRTSIANTASGPAPYVEYEITRESFAAGPLAA